MGAVEALQDAQITEALAIRLYNAALKNYLESAEETNPNGLVFACDWNALERVFGAEQATYHKRMYLELAIEARTWAQEQR